MHEIGLRLEQEGYTTALAEISTLILNQAYIYFYYDLINSLTLYYITKIL